MFLDGGEWPEDEAELVAKKDEKGKLTAWGFFIRKWR